MDCLKNYYIPKSVNRFYLNKNLHKQKFFNGYLLCKSMQKKAALKLDGSIEGIRKTE